MGKTLSFLFILIATFGFILNPPVVSAIPTCVASGVNYEPRFFLENTTIKIKFTFIDSNSQIATDAQGKYARLNISKLLSPSYKSDPVQITGNSFEIEIKDAGLKKPAVPGPNHTGFLQISTAPTSFPDDPSRGISCEGIQYQVGSGDKCQTDPVIPSQLPLDKPFPIKFIGISDTDYKLTMLPARGTYIVIGTARTDAQGQGRFDNVTISSSNAGNGDKISLSISVNTSGKNCFNKNSIEININAKPPASPGSGIIMPGAATLAKFCLPGDPACSSAGGLKCEGETKPAFKTALGCIHTNPADLVQDVLKFGVGIGGGLAFLMMLLGAFQMLTSAGNPETLAAGKDRLTSAIIGLLFIIFAVLLLQIIGVDILGILKR